MNEEKILALSPGANIQKPVSQAGTPFGVIAKKLLSQMASFFLQSYVIGHLSHPYPL